VLVRTSARFLMGLFTAVFLLFMVGSGERIATVRSQQPVPEEACWLAVAQYREAIEQQYEQRKGIKVFAVGMCVPEERKA
jgi:hypothetical protein